MKKKIALLLTAVMALSPLSAISVSAYSENHLSNANTTVAGKTLFFEVDGIGIKDGYLNLFPAGGKEESDDDEKIEYAVDGTNLVAEMKDNSAKKGSTFKVELTNARWFFRNDRTGIELTQGQINALMAMLADQAEPEVHNVLGKPVGGASKSKLLAYGVGSNPDTTTSEPYTTPDAETIKDVIANGVSALNSDGELTRDLEKTDVILFSLKIKPNGGISSKLAKEILALIAPTTSGGYFYTSGLSGFGKGYTKKQIAAHINIGKVSRPDPFAATAGGQVQAPVIQDLLKNPEYPTAQKDFTTKGAKILKDRLPDTRGFVNNHKVSTYKILGSDFIPTEDDLRLNNKDFSVYEESGIFLEGSNTYIRFHNDVNYNAVTAEYEDNTEVLYSMVITDDPDDKEYVGTVELHQDFERYNRERITFPVVALSYDGEGDLRVGFAKGGNFTGITFQDYQFGVAASTNTKTTVTNANDLVAKYNLKLNRIEIQEKVPGSIQPGQIVLKAPYGFNWSDPTVKSRAETTDKSSYPIFKAFENLTFDGATSRENIVDGTYMNYGVDDKGKVLKDILIINTSGGAKKEFKDDYQTKADLAGLGINPSRNTNGKLAIEGVSLIAEDYAPLDEKVYFTITGTGITEEDVFAGTRKEWGVEFKTLNDPTTLINGRYFGLEAGTDDKDLTEGKLTGSEFDKDHKTAKVKFSENVVASWWGLRESEFTLPEGVKFRKVKIDKETNFDHIDSSVKELNGTYYPSSEKKGYVNLSATKLKINDLEIKRDKVASFEMEIWVSIESGWEGDIMLTPGGNDIMKEITPLKIATAVSPVTVKAEVNDVKIGYQWQKVSDFTITETAAGRLKKDTVVKIMIDDNITGNDGIAIAPDFVVESNTDSNMQFSKPSVNKGEISFNIERQSHKNAASIKFSNVYVKIDRTVPESNKRPYKVVAGGSAIAANYSETTPKTNEPKFSVKGIGTDYLNVVTSANDKDSILSNVVRVTIGSADVLVGKDTTTKTITMDTAAYISAESNSTMVPVRFVSVALGIPENQISWDKEARTVTIYNGARIIQFKAGSDQIIVNGVTNTMYSPDDVPLKVKSEMKDNRAFLPFRYLGNALGVEVDWDPETKTAIYNSNLLNVDGDTTESKTETDKK